jgi:arginase
MLGVDACEPALAEATGHGPLLEPSQVVLVAHSLSHPSRFERSEIERLRLARIALEDVRRDPEDGARRALQLLAARSEHYIIHLDVDVFDFTDEPLSEHPSRNTGLRLARMVRALKVLASGPGLAAITLAELNPHQLGIQLLVRTRRVALTPRASDSYPAPLSSSPATTGCSTP